MEWICPDCEQTLRQDTKNWFCANGHSFDIAKQGYINLHAVQVKNSKQPGDSKTMIQARRRFLSAGHYQVLVASLIQNLMAVLADKPGSTEWLDIGCGEGFYVEQLNAVLPQIHWHGIDISKEAIKLAAKTNNVGQFAVASNRHIPVADHCCDGVLQIFSPGFDTETTRVLKPAGTLIRVTPGPEHLREIKDSLYEATREHQPATPPAGFTRKETSRVEDVIHLRDPAAIDDLLQMTPYRWRGNRTAKSDMVQKDNLTVHLDFTVEQFEKQDQA